MLITAEEWDEMKVMEAEESTEELTYEEDPDGLDEVPDEYEDEYAA